MSDVQNPVLENATAGGNPPRKRVGSALAAQRIYEDLSESSALWAAARARIQAVYDGNPPFNAADLERLGQSHRTNVNFRELESIIDVNAAAAWGLHMDIGPMIDCKIDQEYLPPDSSGLEWTDIIAEEYTRTLLEWTSFYYNVDMVTKDCFKYGVGGMIWEDEWDWRSKAFQIGNLKVPARAKCDPDQLGLFCLSDELSIDYLYKLTENREQSEKAGWNIGAVKKLLVKVYVDHSQQNGTEDKEQTSDWESYQAAVRTYDPDCAVMDYDGVRVIHLVVKEAVEMEGEGMVSHYIIAEDEGDDVEFLFKKERRYNDMSEVLWLLPHNYGDGAKIRSIKGLGHRSLMHCEASNRFLCQLMDSGMLASSLLVQLTKSADVDELQMLRLGAVTVLPAALTPVQTSFVPKMDSLAALRAMSKDILLNNTGIYRPKEERLNDSAAYPTAQQVRQEAKTEAKFEHNQATFFYLQWQRWHQETFRRLTNMDYLMSPIEYPGQLEARVFQMRCMKRGIPPFVLMTPGIVQVFSAKALGMGSTDERQSIANKLVAMKGSMDERGRKWVDRQWAMAHIGAWNTDKVFPVENRDKMPSNATSLAVLENNSALDGRMPVVGSDQLHEIHAQTHLAPLARYAEIFTKQGFRGLPNPREVVNAFQILLPHLQQTVQQMAQDPSRKAQMKAWVPALKQLAVVGQKIVQSFEKLQTQQVRQQQSQQQQGGPMDAEMQLKAQKMIMEMQLENKKQDSLNQMRAQKTADQSAIRAQQSQAQTQLAATRTAGELEIMKQKAEAEIAMQQAKTISKMQADTGGI